MRPELPARGHCNQSQAGGLALVANTLYGIVISDQLKVRVSIRTLIQLSFVHSISLKEGK